MVLKKRSEPTKDWQRKIRCKKCQDIIWSSYSGEFVTCKCGAISVDQTPHYGRWIGDLADFERSDIEQT